MAAQMTPRFRDLPDVNWPSFADGEVATYDTGTDTITGEVPEAGGGGDVTAQDLADHNDDTTFVHGIVNTGDLATDTELTAHSVDTTAVHGIADTTNIILAGDSRLTDSRTPSGAAGGVLSGTFPNPGFAADMATQAELNAHESDTTVHGVDTANVPTSGQKAALAGTTGAPGVANRYVTETDPGLGGGVDVDDVIIKAPDTTADNIVQPLANDAVGLTIEAHATQAADLQVWRNPDGDVFAAVGNGVVGAAGAFVSAQTTDAATFVWSTGGISAWPAATGDRAFGVSLYTDADYRFQVLGDGTAQWGNGTDALDTELSRVDVNVLAAPSLEFSEVTAPATPGANKGRLFFRDSSGTTQACVKFPSGNVVVIAEDF